MVPEIGFSMLGLLIVLFYTLFAFRYFAILKYAPLYLIFKKIDFTCITSILCLVLTLIQCVSVSRIDVENQ